MYRLFIVILCLIISGCNDSSVDENNSPLRITFSIKDKFDQEVSSFVVGDEITMEIKIENTINTEVTYQATGPENNFSVTKDDIDIWSQYYGMAFPQVISNHKIAANETLVLRTSWSCKNNEGALIQSGAYKVDPKLSIYLYGKQITSPDAKLINLN